MQIYKYTDPSGACPEAGSFSRIYGELTADYQWSLDSFNE